MLCQAGMVVFNKQAGASKSRGDFSAVLPQSYTRQSQLKLGSDGFWRNMRWICSECVTWLNHQPGTAVLVVHYIHCSYGIEVIFLETLNSLVLSLHGRSSLWMCIDSTLLCFSTASERFPVVNSSQTVWFAFSSLQNILHFFVWCLIFHYFQWIKRKVCPEKNDNT